MISKHSLGISMIQFRGILFKFIDLFINKKMFNIIRINKLIGSNFIEISAGIKKK